MNTAPPHPIAQRLDVIIEFLRVIVAECGGRRQIPGPLTVRLWMRLGRISVLFAALAAHLTQFGADAPQRKSPMPRAADAPRKPRKPRRDPAERPMRPSDSPLRLPGRFAWLAVMHIRAVAAGSRLQHLLSDPETQALLAASPRMRKLLHPLCHMLGVKLPPIPRSPRIANPDAPATEGTADATADVATDADPESPPPRPPRRRRRRLWRPPSRRSDMMTLLRMGTPLLET